MTQMPVEVDTTLPEGAFLGADDVVGLEMDPGPIVGPGASPGIEIPSGEKSSLGGGGSESGSTLIEFAKQWIGTPYKWGGTSLKSGVDCSGFTQAVFAKFGITIPRISNQQGYGGKAVPHGNLQPGDLVFWDNSERNNGADHVGIYIGGGQFIAAPKPGGSVEISNLYGDYWGRRYL
jgi:cell wall-associated NlpC family hydrolase